MSNSDPATIASCQGTCGRSARCSFTSPWSRPRAPSANRRKKTNERRKTFCCKTPQTHSQYFTTMEMFAGKGERAQVLSND